MRNKRKKGFTLIELLAIIVILAIIAVITVPIILNIIDNSKKGAIVNSANGYLKSLEIFIAEKKLDNINNSQNGTYYIKNGKIKQQIASNTIEYEIPISGEKPTSGILTYTNNKIEGNIIFDNYIVSIEDSTPKEAVKINKTSDSFCEENNITNIKGCLILNESKEDYDESINIIKEKTNEITNSDGSIKQYNSNSESGLFIAEDDYTENSDFSYFYRGNVNNNYVFFANYYWRIIRINGDGSIRLLYNGKVKDEQYVNMRIGKAKFNVETNNPAYVGYMYGNVLNQTNEQTTSNIVDSNIKTQLDQWYKTYIYDSGYNKYVSDSGFCNDRSFYQGTGYQTSTSTLYNPRKRLNEKKPSYKCEKRKNDLFTVSSDYGNQALTYPIGLITSDELLYAGNIYDSNNNTSGDLNLWTYADSYYWTMSPNAYMLDQNASFEYSLSNVSAISNSRDVSNYEFGIRPVINIKSNAKIYKGNGTKENPYIIDTSEVDSTSTGVSEVLKTGMTYFINQDNLVYESFTTPFDSNTINGIDCSSFVQLSLSGIKYENSKYNNTKNEITAKSYFNFPDVKDTYINERQGSYVRGTNKRYYSYELAKYAIDNGYSYNVADDYSNVQAGDVLFYAFRDNSTNYLGIDHVVLAMDSKDGNRIKIFHVANNIGTENKLALFSAYSKEIKPVLGAHFPLENNSNEKTNIIYYDDTERNSNSGLIYGFTANNLFNFESGTPYTIIAKIDYNEEDNNIYVGIRGRNKTTNIYETLDSYNGYDIPSSGVYKFTFIPNDIDVLQFYILGSNESDKTATMKWFKVYEGIL